ncbi:MAG: hypothetical protein HYY84_06725 [Deltaproteobacteria bacterium]|nr:hypothetical protein [Deltaproteobacteria bacterium]
MKSVLIKIDSLMRSDNFAQALEMIRRLKPGTIVHPDLMVREATCRAMLNCDEIGFPADGRVVLQVQRLLTRAVATDPWFVQALLELAWHYRNTRDDARRARPLFERAFEICRWQMTETIDGLARCIAETESKAAGLRFLSSVQKRLVNKKELAKTQREIRDYLRRGGRGAKAEAERRSYLRWLLGRRPKNRPKGWTPRGYWQKILYEVANPVNNGAARLATKTGTEEAVEKGRGGGVRKKNKSAPRGAPRKRSRTRRSE